MIKKGLHHSVLFINLKSETLEVILFTIQRTALLEFLQHQIIGNLQTRYHVFPHSTTHISYNTAPLKYLFIYLPADRHLGWVRVELDKPWLEKR